MIYTTLAYTLWGIIPIYWGLLHQVPSGEILAHRIIWSFVFLCFLILFIRKWKPFISECKKILKDKKTMIKVALATIFISINWLLFIWSINNGHIIQTSLGYYINPLISILLGIIILKEKSTRSQNIAFILAGIGVLYLTISLGIFPWISLVLAITFALYGYLKKTINLNSIFSVTIETMMVSPIALMYILFLPVHHYLVSDPLALTNWLLMGAGIVTATPMLLFSSGAKHIPLAMVGILQYIAPTLTLIIGVFLFNEAFTLSHLISFLFIWAALLIYMSSHFKTPVKKVETERIKQLN